MKWFHLIIMPLIRQVASAIIIPNSIEDHSFSVILMEAFNQTGSLQRELIPLQQVNWYPPISNWHHLIPFQLHRDIRIHIFLCCTAAFSQPPPRDVLLKRAPDLTPTWEICDGVPSAKLVPYAHWSLLLCVFFWSGLFNGYLYKHLPTGNRVFIWSRV